LCLSSDLVLQRKLFNEGLKSEVTYPNRGIYYTEFEAEMISNNELSNEMVDFANAEGGTIYFGIDDGSVNSQDKYGKFNYNFKAYHPKR